MAGRLENLCAIEIEELESIIADWAGFSPQTIQRMLQWLISFYAEVHAKPATLPEHTPRPKWEFMGEDCPNVLDEAQGNVDGLPEHPEGGQSGEPDKSLLAQSSE